MEDSDDNQTLYKTYSKSYVSMLESQAEKHGIVFNNLRLMVENKKYAGNNDLSRRLYGAMAAMSPQTSLENLELLVGLAHSAFLADIEYTTENPERAAKFSPSATYYKDALKTCATDSMFVARQEILEENARVFLCCDKGAKKKPSYSLC